MADWLRRIAGLIKVAVLSLGLACGFGLGAVAQAQQPSHEASPVQRCLTLTDQARDSSPEYPFIAFKAGVQGRVKVELIFTVADRRPEVKVIEAWADEDKGSGVVAGDFVAAVRDFARHYRVPCLDPTEVPARFAVEYLFRPEQQRPSHGPLEDLAQAERSALWRCVRHVSGEAQMDFPAAAARRLAWGRVFVRLRFVSPEQPPEVTVFARDKAEPLANAVRHWVLGLRLPCATSVPFETTLIYRFAYQRDAYGFKPGVSFMDLFRSMPPRIRGQMPRDTTAMGCPFDVRVTYLQPLLANQVGVLGNWAPAREPFLAWLRTAELELPARSLDSIFGDDILFSVPCLKSDPTS